MRDVLCEDRFFREIFWVSEVRSLLLKVLVTWPGRCGWLAGRRCSRKAGSGERVGPDDRCRVLYTPTSFQPRAGSGYGEQKSNSSKTSRCLRWINGGHQQVWLNNNLSLFTPSLFHAYYELELCCTNSSVTVDLCSFLHKGKTLFHVHMELAITKSQHNTRLLEELYLKTMFTILMPDWPTAFVQMCVLVTYLRAFVLTQRNHASGWKGEGCRKQAEKEGERERGMCEWAEGGIIRPVEGQHPSHIRTSGRHTADSRRGRGAGECPCGQSIVLLMERAPPPLPSLVRSETRVSSVWNLTGMQLAAAISWPNDFRTLSSAQLHRHTFRIVKGQNKGESRLFVKIVLWQHCMAQIEWSPEVWEYTKIRCILWSF